MVLVRKSIDDTNVDACIDFTSRGVVIIDFASVKNQIIDSASNGYGAELSDIIDTIDKQTAVDPKELLKHFWNMFVIDAFIGNWDRHNGNWGFLYTQKNDHMEIAPIFDCGWVLFPQIDDELIKKVILSKAKMNACVYDVPTSANLIDAKKQIMTKQSHQNNLMIVPTPWKGFYQESI